MVTIYHQPSYFPSITVCVPFFFLFTIGFIICYSTFRLGTLTKAHFGEITFRRNNIQYSIIPTKVWCIALNSNLFAKPKGNDLFNVAVNIQHFISGRGLKCNGFLLLRTTIWNFILVLKTIICDFQLIN